MNRTKILLLVCFVAAFAAGTTAGLVVRGSPQPPPPRGHSRLEEELKLTADQRDQMHKIWGEVAESGRQYWDRRRAIADERDKAFVALLTPEQKPPYDKVQQDYTHKMDLLSQERKLAYDRADERMKQILTSEQYEQWKKQRDRGFGGARPRRGGPRSRPASDESNTPRVGG